MEGRNLFCGQLQCGRPAYLFGFNQLGDKLLVCRDHTLVLTDKRIPVFDIAAFAFIESLEDSALYEQRRGLMHQGMGNIAVLEAQCESDLEEAEKRIQTTVVSLQAIIASSLQELRLKTQQCYANAKQQLKEWRTRLESLTANKSFQMNAIDEVLCQKMPVCPLFRLALGDCSVSVAQTLASHWHILPPSDNVLVEILGGNGVRAKLIEIATMQKAKGNYDVAKEAADYSEELGEICAIYSTKCPPSGPSFRQVALNPIAPQRNICIFCDALLTEGGIKLVCEDYTHPQCLYNRANECIHSSPPTRVVCTCGIEIYADNFMEWFDYRASTPLAYFFQQNPMQYDVCCPRCGPDSEVLQISRKLNTSQSAQCPRCGCIYCVLCLDPANDQFHAGGTCKYLVAFNQINELESAKMKAVQCSRCLLVQEKGQGWQLCQFCQYYFCAECVVGYDVINSHGHCYHREDCSSYSPHDLKSGAFCQECHSCNVKGGDDACDKPQTLARQGQFAPWEIRRPH